MCLLLNTKYIECKHTICERKYCKAFLDKQDPTERSVTCPEYKIENKEMEGKCEKYGYDYCLKPSLGDQMYEPGELDHYFDNLKGTKEAAARVAEENAMKHGPGHLAGSAEWVTPQERLEEMLRQVVKQKKKTASRKEATWDTKTSKDFFDELGETFGKSFGLN